MTQNDKPTDGGYAFPVADPYLTMTTEDNERMTKAYKARRYNGMTLRDYFAGQALAGMMANEFYARGAHEEREKRLAHVSETMAVCSYEAADAMLAARDSSKK